MCDQAKVDRDKKTLKRETQIEYKSAKQKAVIQAIDKDGNVLTRLKTATGVQVQDDMSTLKKDPQSAYSIFLM